MKIALVHPDLGIGGAEKLIVEVGSALKNNGHIITCFTSHYDPNHSFPETKDGTLIVCCRGDWLPRSLLGKFNAFCSYLRIIFLAFYVLLFYRNYFHTILCDQISICIPILKTSCRKVIFYCHYPDKLLTDRKSLAKRLYRGYIDWLEEWSIGKADLVLVNSEFTKQVFLKNFPTLSHIRPQTLYPSLNFDNYRVPRIPPSSLAYLVDNEYLFLSINRYERKKNIALAIQAFKLLDPSQCSTLSVTSAQWLKCSLVIAGGYDERVIENIQYYDYVVQLSRSLLLNNKVYFLRSISSDEKYFLLSKSFALLYTPEFEHFGIVPLEAMYMKLPVIAHNSGGPKETVLHGKTGILCESGEYEFARAMNNLIINNEIHDQKVTLGNFGHHYVKSKFSFKNFARDLELLI